MPDMKSRTDTLQVTTLGFNDCQANNKSRARIRNPLLALTTYHAMTREYLRNLRAAEMKEWELSGGDYLIVQEALSSID